MKEYLTSLLESFVAKEDVAGVNVLVTKDLEPLYQKSLGFADLENRTPMAPDTIFRIFSMSKEMCIRDRSDHRLYHAQAGVPPAGPILGRDAGAVHLSLIHI